MPGKHNQLGDHAKACFRTMLDLARQKNIDLRIALGPTHVVYLEGVAADQQWELFLDWIKAVVEIVDKEASQSGGAPFTLVDFNGYHSFNQEKMPDQGVAQYYFDPFHFTPKLGSLMMDLLMGSPEPLKAAAPGSFGVWLNRDSIDAQIQAYRQQRARFTTQTNNSENRRE